MIDYDNKDWAGILFRVRGTVIPEVVGRVLFTGAVGVLAAWLCERHGVKVPPIAHTLLGVALGLLLVFRNGASYDRFWEGRRLLGAMTNRMRDLARQIGGFMDGDEADAIRDRGTLERHIRLVYALMCQSLRRERDLDALGDLATAEERAALEPVSTRPNVVMAWITSRLVAAAKGGRLTEQRLQAMDANLTAFADNFGGAERILKTPLPFAYAHHIKTFLSLFVFTAPFAMADAMRWLTPIAAGLLALGLFGIEEIGVQIEDPFGRDPNDLPLERIGETIATDVGQLLPSAGG